MSEIREAFKKWLAEQTGNQHAIDDYKTAALEFAWRAWQAALQSVEGAEPVGYLTNQAVARLQSDARLNGEHLYAFKPDDMSKFREVYLRPCTETTAPVAFAVFEDNGNIRIWGANGKQVDDLRSRFGKRLRPLYATPTVKDSLTAQIEPIGYADPDTLSDYRAGDRLHIPVYRPDASADWQAGIPVYLHTAPQPAHYAGVQVCQLCIRNPVQPRHEVQAEALEEYADELDAVFARAQETSASNCPAWHAGQFAKDARKQAARLRSNGGES
ncbi:hypothetical protein [Alcanivorax sp.]|jgi:hypothetical protein|uniref:hypothetical protein n=1 Tax=Alcanivorax sp. TaxID=1872427 RepID=UPI0032D91626